MRAFAHTPDNATRALPQFAVEALRARFSGAMAGLQQTPALS
jgi:hypothetical protein